MTQSIHPAAAHGFSQGAALYQQVRPDYPATLVPWLKQQLPDRPELKLLDLGTGTGKFLPTLLQLSSDILAVDPVAEMLQQLTTQFPNIQSVQGSSTQLPCANQQIDAIFCAQSFHWFAQDESLKELHRVLKPQGDLFLIWNQRDIRVNWVNALAESLLAYEGNTPRYHSGQWQQVMNASPLFENVATHQITYLHEGRVEDVVSRRLLSTSFIASMPAQQQQQLKHTFEEIVQRHTGLTAQNHIAFPYVTHVYHYRRVDAV
jgi:ubiquinone/menaquinone biosynthesis C-methylase UbiE